jgi:glycosyltransferase involved in cell wall biosynthesis
MNGPMPEEVVLPYPLDPRLLSPEHETSSENESPPLVFFAARNDPVKGASVLLEAIPLIRRAVPQVNFLFAGYQPGADVTCPDGVRCVPFMPKDELLAYYRRAALCVIPSLWDNSPNTVYEAMAAGRAVVASRVGGIPELVADGETGLLVPPGNAADLAEAITTLLRDPGRRRAMGCRGRQRIQRLAGLEENVTQRLTHYERFAAAETTRRTRNGAQIIDVPSERRSRTAMLAIERAAETATDR